MLLSGIVGHVDAFNRKPHFNDYVYWDYETSIHTKNVNVQPEKDIRYSLPLVFDKKKPQLGPALVVMCLPPCWHLPSLPPSLPALGLEFLSV